MGTWSVAPVVSWLAGSGDGSMDPLPRVINSVCIGKI
jgi:hypothetical protein